MKVSMITTCFNREATIKGAIESVLNQDYPNIEYIIIDGQSTDNSLSIINSYKERLSMVVSEKDHGMYEAINKGIRLATGDIVGLVHSDDFLFDNHVISNVAEAFEKTNADFIYGDGIYVNAEDTNKIIRNWIGGSYHKWKVGLGWLPLHTTCFIRREVMMREGLYDETYKIASDSDLLFRYLFLADLNVYYLKKRIVRMRMGGLSTDREKRKLMFNEDLRVYRSHGRWGIPSKLLKMAWKVPQYIEAMFIR